jgi:hypothetical protein
LVEAQEARLKIALTAMRSWISFILVWYFIVLVWRSIIRFLWGNHASFFRVKWFRSLLRTELLNFITLFPQQFEDALVTAQVTGTDQDEDALAGF